MTRRTWMAWAFAGVLVGACGSSSTSAPSASTSAATTSVAPSSAPASTSASASVIESASASTSASPAASTTTFTSPFYGYTVTLPAGWTATPATVKWDGKGAPGSDDPAVDKFQSDGQASVHAFAAPISIDLAGYAADVMARNAQFHGDTCPPKPDSVAQTTVGTDPGTFIAWNCGILINLALGRHADTGYEFVFRDPSVHQATDAADRATFDAMLKSVTFGS